MTRGQQDPLPTTKLQVRVEGEERTTLTRGQQDPLPTTRLQVRGELDERNTLTSAGVSRTYYAPLDCR